MNKTLKDIITRVIKDSAYIILVGVILLLITLMFFAEAVVFSKETIIVMLGICILGIGIGGIVAATFIALTYYGKKVAKMEETINKQKTQLQNAEAYIKRYNPPKNPTHQVASPERVTDFFSQIADLSETPSNDSVLAEADNEHDVQPEPMSTETTVSEDT